MQARDGRGGVRRGAALGSYTMLPSSTGHGSIPASPFWQRVRIAELDGRRGGRHLSVCRSLPTLKHEGWKSIWDPKRFQFQSTTAIPAPRFRAQAAPAFSVRLPGKHRLRTGRITETRSAGFLAPPPGRPSPPRAERFRLARAPSLPPSRYGPDSQTPRSVLPQGLAECRD